MITDAYGFVTHEEGDTATPGGAFSNLINMEPVGTAVKAYVDAFVIAHNANPTDSIVAALIGTPSSLTAQALGAVPYVATSGSDRDTHWGTPATAAARRALQDSGALTLRLDLGNIQQYFAGLTDGGSNPGGKATPGWYQVTLGSGSVVPYVAASSAARDTYWGTPATAAARRALQDLAAVTIRTDAGWTEQYFAGPTDGGANPGGAPVAGWYPVAGARPRARVLTSANQNANAVTNTFQPMAFVTESYDSKGMHDPVTNNSRITITQPGYYSLGTLLRVALTGAGTCGVQFRLNGVQISDTFQEVALAGASSAYPQSTARVWLANTDYIEIWWRSTLTGAAAIAQSAACSLEVTYDGI